MTSKIFIAFAITLVLISCHSESNTRDDATEIITEDTFFESASTPARDTNLYVKNQSLLWHVDDTKGFKLKKPEVEGIDNMPAINVIQLINNNFDSIHLDYIKTSHDTIYIRIPRSEMLTERRGSTGAESFMASATFSLTELKGIHYVNFDFVEGDHAAPGVYSRNNFKNLQ